MANWFKIFEVDLDESRMRFALSKMPETWPVWTAVLIECCRHRSDNFSWGANEQELFGFSDRLKISIPKVNAAINILCEIGYCQLSEGRLKVLKWNEKQGDYLARKSRGHWEKRSKYHGDSRILTVNHGDSHIEERRGEESRIEEKKEEKEQGADKPHYAKFQKPNLEEIKLAMAKSGLPMSEAFKFLNYYESNGWKVGKNPMKSWPHAIGTWSANFRGNPQNNHIPRVLKSTPPPQLKGIEQPAKVLLEMASRIAELKKSL